jgi:hypothetical protein
MKFAPIAGALALAISAATAQAAPVSYQFSATLDESSITGYEAGSSVTGHFSYDSDTAATMDPLVLEDGFQIITFMIDNPDAFQLNIGGDVLTSSLLNIMILDSTVSGAEGGEAISFMVDGVTVNGVAGSGSVGLTFLTMGTNIDVLGTTLPSTLNLDDFDVPMSGRSGVLLDVKDGSGSFTVSAVTAVPEPASALTMALGLVLMGGLIGRRRRA